VELRFIEGTTFRQWMAQLAKEPRVKVTLAARASPRSRGAGAAGPLEGGSSPDTYRFAPGTSDVEILKRAHAR
jgi:UPF0755 protein